MKKKKLVNDESELLEMAKKHLVSNSQLINALLLSYTQDGV